MSTHDTALLADAASMVITTQFASTSLLQRKLGVGYAKARDIMDALADRGIVGPADGSRARDVHVAPDDVGPIVAQIRAEPVTAADQTRIVGQDEAWDAWAQENDNGSALVARAFRDGWSAAERAAADQTPATDSERVEQIRARWYEHHIDPTARDARVLLLTEVDVPWLLAEHDRLTALLAEQAATIERVRVLHHPEPVFAFDAECGHDDEEHVTFEGRDGGTLCQDTPTGHACTDCRDELGDPVDWPCLTVRALGSQRTEGQG